MSVAKIRLDHLGISPHIGGIALRDDAAFGEHNMDFVMTLCTRVLVLAEGKVLAVGKPNEVRSNPQVIEAYLGH